MMTIEERQKIREAIREGEEIAKRVTDLVAKLKPLIESEAPLKSAEPARFVSEEPDPHEEKAQRVTPKELKGY